MTARHLAEILVASLLAVLVGSLLACGSSKPHRDVVPAEIEAEEIDDEIMYETKAAVIAEASARVAQEAASSPSLTPEKQAAKREEADRQRSEGERHRALAAELSKIRDEARRRAVDQRNEIDRRAEAAAAAADSRSLEWIVAAAVALSAGAAGLLTWIGVPLRIAWGIPGSVMIAALALSAWIAAGAWIALALGVALSLGIIAGLAVLVVVILREWHHTASAASEPESVERYALNAASKARQSAWVRWILDRMLPAHDPRNN